MLVYTYWETIPGKTISTYLKLCIANLKLTFQNDLLILTPATVAELGIEVPQNKNWYFGGNRSDPTSMSYRSVVARSDYLRMAVNAKIGGFWLDTDTLVLEDFRPTVMNGSRSPDSLLWYTESFFGACRGNPILAAASDRMLDMDQQIWANPGGILQLIDDNPDAVERISYSLVGPGSHPTYKASTAGLVFSDIYPSEFLLNPDQKVLKLYNSGLSKIDKLAHIPVTEFLQQPMLLSRIMLDIEPSIRVWVTTVRWVEQHLA